MTNETIYLKIILILLLISVLFANIYYADGNTPAMSISIDKIDRSSDVLTPKSSVSIEKMSNIPSSDSSSDSSGRKKPLLEVKAEANPDKVDRGRSIEITYVLESQKSDLSLTDVVINVPDEFENIKCINETYINTNKFKNNPHEIHMTGKLDHEIPLRFIYTAKIPLNASLKTYNISKLLKYSKVICASNVTLEIQNNLPRDFEFDLNCYPDPLSEEKNTTTCFAESNVIFGYSIVDEERNGIAFNISMNDSQLWNRSLKTYASKIEYGKIAPGNYSIEVSAKDNDGGERTAHRDLIVIDKTYKQDFADKFLPKIIFILAMLIIFLLIFRLRETLCLNLTEQWYIIQKIVIVLLFIWILLPELIEINFLTFILVIYFSISILAIGLIEVNFSHEDSKLRCHLPEIHLIKKVLYCLIKSTLTLAVIFCMTISVLIVGFSLPFNFSNGGVETHYSYIFYYYSAVVQLFGTILSIVAMFTIWCLQDKGLLEYSGSIIKKLKDFMLLYISVILLSLCGLALERIPDLDVVGKMDSLASSGAVFIFETTMLLAAPAMAALFRLASNFIDLTTTEARNHNQSETAAAHPRAASCGASEAPPHENGTRLRRSKPMLNTYALYPSRSKLRGIAFKNKKIKNK